MLVGCDDLFAMSRLLFAIGEFLCAMSGLLFAIGGLLLYVGDDLFATSFLNCVKSSGSFWRVGRKGRVGNE